MNFEKKLKTISFSQKSQEHIEYLKSRSTLLDNDSVIVRKALEFLVNYVKKNPNADIEGIFDKPDSEIKHVEQNKIIAIEQKPLTIKTIFDYHLPEGQVKELIKKLVEFKNSRFGLNHIEKNSKNSISSALFTMGIIIKFPHEQKTENEYHICIKKKKCTNLINLFNTPNYSNDLILENRDSLVASDKVVSFGNESIRCVIFNNTILN